MSTGSRAPEGAIFDLDGVLTQTARVHFEAWKRTFDDFLEQQVGADFTPFTHDADYLPYVDGKPRFDGVASFLGSRGIELPRGDVDDPPGEKTICGVGNAKNAQYRQVIAESGADVYQSSVELVDELIRAGVRVAVASSSRNCSFILEKTGLIDRFGAVVDGEVSHKLDLPGKPDPAIFVEAAKRIDADPRRSIMVEDAVAGVQAGRNGAFGLVLGVARDGDLERLRSNGAHIAVTDLAQISVAEINEWFADRDSGAAG